MVKSQTPTGYGVKLKKRDRTVVVDDRGDKSAYVDTSLF